MHKSEYESCKKQAVLHRDQQRKKEALDAMKKMKHHQAEVVKYTEALQALDAQTNAATAEQIESSAGGGNSMM